MADYSEHYNLKKPSQDDFYNVDDFNDNADKIDSALYAADVKLGQAAQESTLEEVKTDVAAVSNKIGTATDTGGTATGGTLMAKINKLIGDIATHVSAWTAARAAKIDTINTNVSVIGKTTDTGGSDTAGTVMGKLNKLFEKIANEHSFYTFGTSNTFALANSSTAPDITTSSEHTYVVVGKPFKCEHSGYLDIDLSATYTNYKGGWSDAFTLYMLTNTDAGVGSTRYTPSQGGSSMEYADLPHGTVISTENGRSVYELANFRGIDQNKSATLTYTGGIKVEKGDVVRMVLGSGSPHGKFSNITGTIKYGIRVVE